MVAKLKFFPGHLIIAELRYKAIVRRCCFESLLYADMYCSVHCSVLEPQTVVSAVGIRVGSSWPGLIPYLHLVLAVYLLTTHRRTSSAGHPQYALV